MPSGWTEDDVDRWIAYHGTAAKAMVAQRTSLESQLVPIIPYILISAVECYRRHPEMCLTIDAAMPAEEIGAAGRRPGNQIDAVHLWSQANIFLHGRQILIAMGLIPPDHEPARSAVVLDFWKRAAQAYRGDGHLQAFDTDLVVRPYPSPVVDELHAGTVDVAQAPWDETKKLNAALTTYLFLLYFDTRAGYGDSGPYDLGDGKIMLVREFNELGVSHFWWTPDVQAQIGHRYLVEAFVLDGVDLHVNDWGTSITEPADYLDRTVRYGLFSADDGALRPVPLDEIPVLHKSVRDAQRKHYRNVAGWERNKRIDAGAYVYFTFLRPFAEIAGIADDLDWTVPRDSTDVYEMLTMFESGAGDQPPPDPDAPYYVPLHPE